MASELNLKRVRDLEIGDTFLCYGFTCRVEEINDIDVVYKAIDGNGLVISAAKMLKKRSMQKVELIKNSNLYEKER